MKLKIILLALFVSSGTLISCVKYDEGPFISFRTKKSRVANNWLIESATLNGQDVTPIFAGLRDWTFTKDGYYTKNYENSSFNENGKWEFTDEEKMMKVTSNLGITINYTILKLGESSMWLEWADGTNKTLIKLK
jgi:hypothetical protein